MPLTYAGAASLRRSGLGSGICSSFPFAIGCNAALSSSSFQCVSSLILKNTSFSSCKLYSAYAASFSFPLSPVTSFFAEPESSVWCVTNHSPLWCWSGCVSSHLSLGYRSSISLHFLISPFALEKDKGSPLISLLY